eukprot:TRINITY_DN2659_c0_g3_i1.p1 TRINITY_DN2659_c0_g3~~TRINITY_DN2659_c0_g3_i1.p1  ORF type:complete len:301 (+),score=34.24 TRINITY_DN2659_c0_g3_i1:83-904(+)
MSDSGNRNAYLCLHLADLKALKDLGLHIAQRPKEMLMLGSGSGPAVEDDGNGQDADLNFDAQENLHITFVFFGEALGKAASRETIEALHAAVREFVSDRAKVGSDNGAMTLLLDSFDFFPPEKQNLIVAKWRFSDPTHELLLRRFFLELHAHAYDLSLRGAPDWLSSASIAKALGVKKQSGPLDSARLVSVVRNSISDEEVLSLSSPIWQPHITLGKIRCSKKVLSRLSLKTIQSQTTVTSLDVIGFLMVPTTIPRREWSFWDPTELSWEEEA